MQLAGLAAEQMRHGHAVEIITAMPGDPWLDGIRVHRLPGFRIPLAGVTASTRQFAELRATLGSRQFDVVHVHSGIIAPLAYGAARIAASAGLPAVFTFHSIYDYLRPALRALGWIGAARDLPIVWSAVSRFVARETRETLGLREVLVLPNGIDIDAWRRHEPTRFDGELRVVSVMRLHPRKRARALFTIVDRAQRMAGPDVKISLDIVGDGVERPAIERLARERAGQVRLHGWLERDAIARLLAQSHVFLLPTRMESFGIAALEAMSAGLPVLARRDTGVEDFVIDGENGLLGRSDDDLAKALARLAGDGDLRASIAARNRSGRPPYAWPEVAAQVEAAYASAIPLQPGAAAR